MLWLYTVLIYIAAPVALLHTLWRSRSDPAYRDRWSERWGFTKVSFKARPLWIHAVSVGEVQASAVLARALLKRYPERPLLITTGTPTGAQRVKALFGPNVQHAFLPYDMPGSVRRFLDRVHPMVGIVMETEIWPNLFRASRRRGIPLLIASARLSEKSVRVYRRLPGLTKGALQKVIVEAQSTLDVQRFIEIGADPANTHVAGNVKFDIQIPSEVCAAGEQLRANEFAQRPVWIAASTHEGEEQAALKAHEEVCSRAQNALLILVPRHPQRFDGIKSMMSSERIRFVARSTGAPVSSDVSVLFADTMGELLMLYAAADVAFVGGSLVPVGGHSLLEPAAVKCPIVTGSYNFNAPDIAQLLIAAEAAIEVKDARELGATVIELLNDTVTRERMTVSAARILEQNRGSLERLLARIEQLMRSLH